MLNFTYRNVKIEKSRYANQVVVRGEIYNNSGMNYSTVAIRIVLFIKSMPISNTVFIVNGLPNGTTKPFEKVIEELEYSQVGKDITHYEIYTENAF